MEAAAARDARDEARLERALAAAVRADPTQVEAHRILAERHQRAHRDADRLRELREVVRLYQHERESLGELVAALLAARAWADLNALRGHASHADPESVALHLALAQAAYETGDPSAAVFEYESALALEPANAAAIRERVEAVRSGRWGLPPIAAPPRATEN